MHLNLYEKYLSHNFDLIEVKEREGNFIKTGYLKDKNTEEVIPIKNFIPRFSDEGYNKSFGIQWHRFKTLQLDSKTGHKHSFNRLVENTKWNLYEMKGKSVLECGCGAGRFTEIFSKVGCDVVAVDMSSAVDVNLENNGLKDNILLLQCDITKMPFFKDKFDYVFCYGVLQHTPDPEKTFYSIVNYLKRGGKISIDIYRKMFVPTCWSTPKYIWRPITRRMNKEKLLKIIEWYIPRYIDFDTFIKKIKGGWLLSGLIPIPCWNYLDRGYSREERIQHAIMDTFDALSPEFDKPKTKRQVEKWFKNCPQLTDIEVFYGSNGIVGNATKRS